MNRGAVSARIAAEKIRPVTPGVRSPDPVTDPVTDPVGPVLRALVMRAAAERPPESARKSGRVATQLGRAIVFSKNPGVCRLHAVEATFDASE